MLPLQRSPTGPRPAKPLRFPAPPVQTARSRASPGCVRQQRGARAAEAIGHLGAHLLQGHIRQRGATSGAMHVAYPSGVWRRRFDFMHAQEGIDLIIPARPLRSRLPLCQKCTQMSIKRLV
jgi:hypothetical protein